MQVEAAPAVSHNQMKKSKHDFVSFVNKATLDKKSPEKQELYKFLVECFIDNDTDYDGQVSFRGFNNMIAQAALAPRRFGFAPHTRELYDTKEAYEEERLSLYNKLRGSDSRVSLEGWLKWADAHIQEKVGDGLVEHTEARWERSKKDYLDFLGAVMQAKSANCKKSSTSTQLKEHYMNSVRQFTTADSTGKGMLHQAQFNDLVSSLQKVPAKHGLTMYDDWTMEKVAPNQGYVTMKDFLDYKLTYIAKTLPTLL